MKLSRLLKNYEGFHQTPKNHLCHFIGIPLISLSLLGGLSHIHLGLGLDLGFLLWLATSARVVAWDWKIAVPFNLSTLGLYLLGRLIPFPVHIALFAIGWVFQLVGHSRYEQNKPAFFANLDHLIVGPIWVFLRCVGRH